MVENYLMQGLFLAIVIVISVRAIFAIRTNVQHAKEEFATVAEVEKLDPRPIRLPRPTDKEDEEEETTDENHIDPV